MTRNELLAMYQQHPGALAEELSSVFRRLSGEGDMAVHNYTIARITRLHSDSDEDWERLLYEVAKAVLRTAREGLRDGQKTEQAKPPGSR